MKARTASALLFLSLNLALDSRAELVPFDSERWTIEASEHRLTEYLDRPSLYMKGGAAWITDAVFTDGIIEFDVAFTGERGFMGGMWRMQDPLNFEDFYIRPHQSGNPDANQYTPVFNGQSGWQLYHGDGYGAPVRYPTNTWIHVKIVFSGSRGEVYIDSEEPVLAIHEMKHPVRAGRVGLRASNFAPAHFSRFSYRQLESPPLSSSPAPPVEAPAGTIKAWSVSSAFAEAGLEGKTVLDDRDKQVTWQTLAAEGTGITNLARITPRTREANTVFARVTLHSESETTKKVRFGYSDRVKVYLNDRQIYGGNNGYQSRDYRYLGTIGLFDEIALPLEQGKNELWFAVSESFGGWGIQAVVDDPSGVRLEPAPQ